MKITGMLERKFSNILDGKGGKMLFIPCPDLKVSVVSVWFPAGSVFDPDGKEGLAHFFEHLMLQKTKGESDRNVRLQHLESEGIDFYAYTQKEVAYFYQIQEPSVTEKSLVFLAEGVADFIFSPEDLNKERSVIASEKAAYEENPHEKVWDHIFSGLYHASPFAHNPFGDEESLALIQSRDIEDFYQERYKFSGATWVVLSPVGDGKEEKKILEEFLAPRLQQEKALVVKPLPMGDVLSSEGASRNKGRSALLAVAFRTGGIANLDEIIKVDLLRSILASGWISWLNRKLRTERSIIYWARSAISQFSDRGYVAFFLDTDNASPDTLAIFDEEIECLKDEDSIVKDLEAHKAAFATRFLRVYHNPEDLLWWYGYPASYGLVSTEPGDYLARVRKITARELSLTAREIFVDENKIVVPQSKPE